MSSTAATGFAGLRGLTGIYSGGIARLYATTASGDRLIQIIDNGATPTSATLLASAGTNYVFRGVDLAPATPPAINPVTLTSSLTNTYGTASPGISYTVTGTNLTGSITNTPATGFEISTDNATWTTNATGVTNNATVWVRTSATRGAGTNNSTVLVTLSGGGAAASVSVTSSASGNVVSKATPNLAITSTNSAVAGGTLPLTASSPSTGTITYTSSNTNVVTVSGTTASMVAAGTATLTASQAADANYNSTTATQNFTVTAPSGSLSVSGTLSAFSSTYGTASSSQSFTVSGSNLNGSGVTVTPPAGFEVSDTSDFTAVGTAASPLSLGSSASINAPVYIRLAASNAVGSVAGGSISISGGGAPGQTLSVPGSTVAKANQATVSGTLASATITYGQTTTVSGSGGSGAGVYEYRQTSGTGVVSFTENTISVTTAGTAVIEVRRLGDGNYNDSGWVSAGTLTVNKASQIITFAALSPLAVSAAPFSLAATSNSGLAVAFESDNTSVATISGNLVTIVGPGTCNITASQSGDGNYSAAPNVVRSLTVNPAGTINFDGTTYTQDFQSMTGTSLTAAGISSTTMLEVSSLDGGGSVNGWYVYHQSSGTPRWGRNAGGSGTGSFYVMFDSANPVNEALGSQGSSTNTAYFGLVLKNTSGSTIQTVNFSYDAVMNRNPSSTPNAYPLSYLVSSNGLAGVNGSTGEGTFNDAAGTWSNGVGFTTPNSGTGAPNATQAAISPLFRIGGAAVTQTLTGLNWSNGAFLYIRWQEKDEGGSDATAGVDNFSIDAKLPVPTIGSLSPSSVVPGGSEFNLTINGGNFYPETEVTVAGVSKTVTYVNSGQLTVPITATEIATGGSLAVVVRNPATGGGGGTVSASLAVNSGPSLSLVPPADNSAFASTIQTPAASRTFTVSGSSLTTGITVAAPSGFEVSTDDQTYTSSLLVPPVGGNVSATTLYVRFNPAAVQSYSGSITAATAGVSPSASFAVLGNTSPPNEGKLSGTFADGAASLTATAPAVGAVDEYIVLAKVGSPITDVPSGNGSAYTANASYGMGTQIGASFVVYKGSEPPSLEVTGLTNGLRYYFSMFSRVATAYSTPNSTNGFPTGTLNNIITQWSFNDANNLSSPSTGVGSFTFTGTITNAVSASGSSTDSGSPNSAASTSGYPASSASASSGTSGLVFNASTAGKQNIVVYWDVRPSNTASRYSQFQYSTDGGATWNNFIGTGGQTESGLYVGNSGDTWFPQRKADLSAISAVNNNANFAFRIVTVFAPGTTAYAAAGTSYGTTGTMRYDMVTVTGTDLSTSPVAPTITSTNAFSGTVGVAFSNTLTASGDGPISFSGTNLPAGLSVATNGLINGTPTAAGTVNAILTATNLGGITNQAVTFTIAKGTPPVAWTNPAAITYGTALSSTQLNATSSVAGTFTYSPTNGAVLNAGTNTLNVTWSPTDTNNYTTASNSVILVVNRATPSITASPSASSVTAGLALSNSFISVGTVNPSGGAWAWSAPTTPVLLGTNSYAAVYTPASSDQANWTTVTTNLTVVGTPAGASFSDFLQGQPTNSETVGKYLIGGATNLNAASERPVMTTNSTNLVLSAIVRTNDVNYSSNQVVGLWVTNVGNFPGTNVVFGRASTNQTGVQPGFERRDFEAPRGTNSRLFLRLRATLNP